VEIVLRVMALMDAHGLGLWFVHSTLDGLHAWDMAFVCFAWLRELVAVARCGVLDRAVA
jgi:hypothetical protein